MSFGGAFQSQPRQQPHQQQDITSTLVQTVKQDVDLWEKGKQWAFSCYSPAKETACVPGIEDVSPEEMRLDAYQARVSGKVRSHVFKDSLKACSIKQCSVSY